MQKICRSVRDEDEVREALFRIWEESKKAGEILQELMEKNRDIYELERKMETRS